jgi:hypothetical protein
MTAKKSFSLAIIALFAFALSFSSANAQKYKKYPHKSGKISYELSGDSKGTRTIYWDDYGMKELTEEHSVTKTWGMKSEANTYVLVLGKDVYSWNDDKDKENVYLSSNPIAEAWMEDGKNNKEVEKSSKDIMVGMGFEKIGDENYKGKNCEIWKGMGGAKTWTWKTYSLKTDVSMLGIDIVAEAKDMDFGASVPGEKFEYPKGRELIESDEQMQKAYEENEEDGEEGINPADVKKALKGLFK